MQVKTYSATGRLWVLGTFKRKVISVSQSSTKFHCGLTFNSQLFMLSWQIQTLIFPCSRLGGGFEHYCRNPSHHHQWPPKLHPAHKTVDVGVLKDVDGAARPRGKPPHPVPLVFNGKARTTLIALIFSLLSARTTPTFGSSYSLIPLKTPSNRAGPASRWAQTEIATTNASHNTCLPTTRIP